MDSVTKWFFITFLYTVIATMFAIYLAILICKWTEPVLGAFTAVLFWVTSLLAVFKKIKELRENFDWKIMLARADWRKRNGIEK